MVKYSGVLLLLLLTSCSDVDNINKVENPKLVKIMTISDSRQQNIRSFPGIVEAKNKTVLSFKVGGTLSVFPLSQGMDLTESDLIGKLDDKDYKVDIAKAESDFDLARSELKRMQKLVEQNLVSQLNIEQIKAAFYTAKDNLEASRNALSYTVIRAPYDLTVAEVHVENFEQISPFQPIVTVHDLSSFNIAIQVPQNIMAMATESVKDHRPQVFFDVKPDKFYEATLVEWVTNSESTTETFKVLYSLPVPPDLNLFPGMTASVNVDLNKIISTNIESSILIPMAALFSSKDGESSQGAVWLVTNEMVIERREVSLGRIVGESIEVKDGLSVGDKIVTAGVNGLIEGGRVADWQKERDL